MTTKLDKIMIFMIVTMMMLLAFMIMIMITMSTLKAMAKESCS